MLARTAAIFLLIAVHAVAANSVSRDQAVRIARDYLRHYHIGVRALEVRATLRHEPAGDATDKAVRRKLLHREHWWVYFTPRDPDVYGGAHSIYIEPATGEVIGWCSER